MGRVNPTPLATIGQEARRGDAGTEVAKTTIGAAVRGLAAGLVEVAAMTAAEKLERVINDRPNSFVPAHTMGRLLRLPSKPDGERLWMSWAMHWGQGVCSARCAGLWPSAGCAARSGPSGP